MVKIQEPSSIKESSRNNLKLRRLSPLPAKATAHLVLIDYFTFIRLRAVDNAHNPRPLGGRRLRRPPWSDSDVESEKEVEDPDPPTLSYFLIILGHNSLFPMFSIIFGHSEEDPLLSIFCILRSHPSGFIAVFLGYWYHIDVNGYQYSCRCRSGVPPDL